LKYRNFLYGLGSLREIIKKTLIYIKE